jgi:hypothetical protein
MKENLVHVRGGGDYLMQREPLIGLIWSTNSWKLYGVHGFCIDCVPAFMECI